MLSCLVLFCTVFILGYGAKQKVIYNNDQGYPGCDGDNPQGLVHFLFYANDIDIQLIIASGSTNCAAAGSNINEAMSILDLYDKDYAKLSAGSAKSGGEPYPTATSLKAITYQGCNHSSPAAGYPPNQLLASQKIIEVVDSLGANDMVWYGAGAGLCELARALHDKPSIASKIGLYTIGSWNTQQDPYSRRYVFENFDDLLYIESNGTFGAWFSGGNQSGIYNDYTFDSEIISKGGNLGAYYSKIVPSQSSNKQPMYQEGDGPAYFYVIDPQHASRNLKDPTQPNWGGQYSKLTAGKPNFYSDDWSKFGGDSIHQFRTNVLDSFKERLEWLN